MGERKTYKEEKLGNYILDIAAGPFGSNLKVDCFVPTGFPIIDGANLKGFKVTDNVTKFVTEEKARSLHRSIAKRNDVIITISGNVGQISYIPNNSKFTEYLVSQRQFRVTFDESKVYVPYLVYYFHTKEGQHKILSFANQTGVPALAQPLKNFRNIDISLPNVQTQRNIAFILESLDDKIALNNRINHNLEEQAQALYKSWFVDFDPFKSGKLVDSEMGIIPEGWRVGLLSELGDIVAGGTPSKAKPEYYTDNGIAWLTPKDLSLKCNKFTARGETDITENGYKNCSAKLMPRGSVLFSSRAPIGYISIAKGDICTNQGFKSVVPTYAGTAYLYYWLCENTGAIEAQASGSTFKEASGSLMKSFPALIPSKDVLDTFEAEINPILREQEILEEENRQLEQLRDLLLPRLMSGEVIND